MLWKKHFDLCIVHRRPLAKTAILKLQIRAHNLFFFAKLLLCYITKGLHAAIISVSVCLRDQYDALVEEQAASESEEKASQTTNNWLISYLDQHQGWQKFLPNLK